MSQLDLTRPACMQPTEAKLAQPPHLPMEIEEHVTANRQARDPPPPLDLEVLPPPPEGQGLWSFPLYRATCRRCGRKFEMIKFEVELGHYLCHKCRFEIIRLGERLGGVLMKTSFPFGLTSRSGTLTALLTVIMPLAGPSPS
jgi:hypothetical protein